MMHLLQFLFLASTTCHAGRLRRGPHTLSTPGQGEAKSDIHGVALMGKANATFQFTSKNNATLKVWRAIASKLASESELKLESGLEGRVNATWGAKAEPASVFEEPQCEIIRQYSSSPSLCNVQNNRIPEVRLQAYMKEFKKFWQDFKTQLPGPTCCMGINHQFAIFATVKELKPQVIIESGVAAGRGTFLLRYAAGPGVPIFSVDPGDPVEQYGPSPPAGIGRGWRDNSGATRYLVKEHFTDLAMTRWDVHIPDPKVRENTLVLLDDHQSSVVRLKMLRNWGFRWAFYEDNYPFGIATSADKNTCVGLGASLPRTFTKPLSGDAYSPNTICAPVPAGTSFVLEKDRFGGKCKFITMSEHNENIKWYTENVQNYFEFPALFSRCSGINRKPLLEPDTKVLKEWGFPDPSIELWQYGHLFPALMDLKPLDTAKHSKLVNGQMQMVSEQSEGWTAAFATIQANYQEIMGGTYFGGR